jgi:acetylornithine deacetylase/succinyl-diaminopimelate desuccinylase-like protein
VKAVIAAGRRCDFGLSVESTRGQLFLGHRGKVEFDIRVYGRAAHAAEPANGISALSRALPILRGIEDYARGLVADPALGRATAVITGCHTWPDNGTAVVPDQLAIRLDRRYIRGETPETVGGEIAALLGHHLGPAARGNWSLVLSNHYPLMFTPEDNPLAKAAKAAIARIGKGRSEVSAWRFGVNGTFMNEAGIPTIGLGPGDEIWAHTPEEHVLVADLVDAARKIALCLDLFQAPG